MDVDNFDNSAASHQELLTKLNQLQHENALLKAKTQLRSIDIIEEITKDRRLIEKKKSEIYRKRYNIKKLAKHYQLFSV
jgi:hypothetical protein